MFAMVESLFIIGLGGGFDKRLFRFSDGGIMPIHSMNFIPPEKRVNEYLLILLEFQTSVSANDCRGVPTKHTDG